ncbi:MAG: hydantoinase/oxoprolinase family protein [Pseudomonadota bacterium]|nr:hydantoinase/oxoprolinase family protein [Pseudomonadota bacterium]
MRIGLDVGGTHTDAVLMDGSQVIARVKATTTEDVTSGIEAALVSVLEGQTPAAVDLLTIGTTQFTNAVVERKQLSRVAAVRVCLPAGWGLMPRADWPQDLIEATDGGSYLIHGGHLYDGRPLSELQERELTELTQTLSNTQPAAVVVSCAFSPTQPDQEDRLVARLAAALPGLRVCASHMMGGLGLIERENASILNASLLAFADRVANALVESSEKLGLQCPVYVSQNDGTLIDLERVRQFPALTFASGPTNSIRGAWALTGLADAIVIDVGGTTSDIGVLKNGFPRQSNLVIDVGGARTNFRMPDVIAIGLGGGSLIGPDGKACGPQSVARELRQKALCFGGTVMTLTDVAVSQGRLAIFDASKSKSVEPEVCEAVDSLIVEKLAAAVDLMKPGGAILPVILVGGGAPLIPGDTLAGCPIVRPDNADVANAIGASIAQVSGEAEGMRVAGADSREIVIENLSEIASEKALAAGADLATIEIVNVEEVDIPYMATDTSRIRVSVVGDLASREVLT